MRKLAKSWFTTRRFLEDAEGADQLGGMRSLPMAKWMSDGRSARRNSGRRDFDLAMESDSVRGRNGGGWLGGFRHRRLLERLLSDFYQQVTGG